MVKSHFCSVQNAGEVRGNKREYKRNLSGRQGLSTHTEHAHIFIQSSNARGVAPPPYPSPTPHTLRFAHSSSLCLTPFTLHLTEPHPACSLPLCLPLARPLPPQYPARYPFAGPPSPKIFVFSVSAKFREIGSRGGGSGGNFVNFFPPLLTPYLPPPRPSLSPAVPVPVPRCGTALAQNFRVFRFCQISRNWESGWRERGQFCQFLEIKR